MKVLHAQAKRILEEQKESGVPGFAHLEYELSSADDDGLAELTLKDAGHASVRAFAYAAGVIEAAPPAPELVCIEQPKIIGLPNVGQYVTASAGVWEEPDPERLGDPGVTPSGATVRWLYDRNEDDPVVIPEGDPHGYGNGGGRELLIPAAAIGREIFLRVTRGATTVYSEAFGPIEGGLTEFTFPSQPTLDSDQVSADPGSRRRDGSSGPTSKTKQAAQTPSTDAATSKKKGTAAELAKPPAAPPKKSKTQALAERAAKETKPLPAADRVSE